jgi:endonuclease YncB( thermonuclease family)
LPLRKASEARQSDEDVRIAFIDAPEKGQPFGKRAKAAMSELVFGKDVELRPHSIDRYGRLAATVYVDGIDAGPELLKAGLAWPYEGYLVEASQPVQESYGQAAAKQSVKNTRSALRATQSCITSLPESRW